jgi:hypothetical protein
MAEVSSEFFQGIKPEAVLVDLIWNAELLYLSMYYVSVERPAAILRS